MNPKPISDFTSVIGEGPMWSVKEQRLYWVDIPEAIIYSYEPATALRKSWRMPDEVCWLVERLNGKGFVAGFKSGLAFVRLEPEISIEFTGIPISEGAGVRINDGKADRSGKIWTGTMSVDRSKADGRLFRIDSQDEFQCVDSSYHVCNGPSISNDGHTLYNTDSYLRRIYAYDLCDDGTLRNRRVWKQFDESDGFPDGMTVDSENCIWVAHWGAGRISRLSPSAEMLSTLTIPASQVTSCTFGGTTLNKLFVTTAKIGLGEEALEKEPFAGATFEIDVDVLGLPAYPAHF